MKCPITLVMLSCGEQSEQDCKKAVDPFKDQFHWFEIKNVFPQVKALNMMIDSVQTEFFVPLDSDMVLYNDGWARIKNAWRRHKNDSSWHSILFPLYDTLTERKILALKLMRTSMMKESLFSDTPTPDVEHYSRLTGKGYSCIHDYLDQRPIGDHRVVGKKFCYAKYRDVYQTYRYHDFEWDSGAFMGGKNIRDKALNHFNYFFGKWAVTGNPDYLHCIAGMMDGILMPLDNKSKTLEKVEYKIDSTYAVSIFMDWMMEKDERWLDKSSSAFI